MTNPLLEPSPHPHGALRFDLLRAEHYLPALEWAIQDAKTQVESISSSQAPATFANVIAALEQTGDKVEWTAAVFYNLFSAETNDELQKLTQVIGPLLAQFQSDVLLNKALFERVRAVYDEKERLNFNVEQSRLLENTYKEFVRNGALLDETKKKRLREVDERLSQLSPRFSENVLKATNAFELYLSKPEEIEGLPPGALEAAGAAAEAKGHKSQYLFTLHAPSFVPFMQYAAYRPAREKMARALLSRAYGGEFDNQPVIMEILKLRHERAQLLGYKTHAHFSLERRMAETPERVMGFLEDLRVASLAAAKRELAEVQACADRLQGPNPLTVWDFAYYAERLKEQKFEFNEEDLRPYFQLEKVIDGVFAVATRLFGLEFQASGKYPTYHPDVKVFEVYKKAPSGREFMGLFYSDFFPRPTKRDGAWMTNYLEQVGDRRPHVAIVCNFTKSTPSKPSLLSLSEVQTLFHEFGHALHSLLSRCEHRSLSGTNVYWDFVELPSQLMENWVQEKAALDLFARHYKTGEKMPEDLIAKLKASRQFLAGYQSLRQINFGFLDMAWFTADPATIQDVNQFEIEATKQTTLIPRIPGSNGSCSFNHIFGGGYSAGYYSYKWAEVLEADAFEYFQERGIFNSDVAIQLESHILSRGGSEHPAELYRKFRGREPDPKALLRRDGLI